MEAGGDDKGDKNKYTLSVFFQQCDCGLLFRGGGSADGNCGVRYLSRARGHAEI